ncbi:hypothetical protein J6G99_02925 [bacterium]|nr:hypothetical protein [bacterium]
MNVNSIKPCSIVKRLTNARDNIYKIVITNTGKKINTEAYDNNDILRFKRIKYIDTYNVGNKKVIEKNTIFMHKRMHGMPTTNIFNNPILVVKKVISRVYNSEGKFLGAREIIQNGHAESIVDGDVKFISNGSKFVKKYIGNPLTQKEKCNYRFTVFSDGIRNLRTTKLSNSALAEYFLHYNNKGLPIPPAYYKTGLARYYHSEFISALKKADNKTLKEMIEYAKLESEKIKNHILNGDCSYGDKRLIDDIFYKNQKMNIK